MNAVLLTVGDELLIGQVVNTNAAWLGERLGLLGVPVERMETVGDTTEAITRALGRAFEDAELCVVTGGLGPTHDDVTKTAVAAFFGVGMRFEEGVLRDVEQKFAARGRVMSEANRVLADVPEGFDVLPNPKGTAPGLWGERGGPDGRRQVVVVMPGVPYEMRAITEAAVEPRLRARATGAVLHRTLLTVGEGETGIAERLAGVLPDVFADGLTLAYLPSLGTVRLRLSYRGADAAAGASSLDRAEARFRAALGDLVFGAGDATLEGVVGEGLVARGLTLALAESCTGGAVAARLTAVAGASRYLRGGVVAYDNAVKTAALGVDAALIEAHGAVSEPVARAMAGGARARLGADVAVSVTGVAGPTGGTPEKPVGTVWLGWADGAGTHAVRLRLTKDRALNVGIATTAALNLIRRQLVRPS